MGRSIPLPAIRALVACYRDNLFLYSDNPNGSSSRTLFPYTIGSNTAAVLIPPDCRMFVLVRTLLCYSAALKIEAFSSSITLVNVNGTTSRCTRQDGVLSCLPYFKVSVFR